MHRSAWIALLVLLIVGCSQNAPRLLVHPDEITVAPGAEVNLSAELRGVGGGVVWTAKKGFVSGDGLTAKYLAPKRASEDVITVASDSNPAVRVKIPVHVRYPDIKGPALVISGDSALIFTHAGEERVLRVQVFDDLGNPDPGARVTFSSGDEQNFSVTPLGPQSAVVRALSDKIQSVAVTASYSGEKAVARAVMARLAPGVRRLTGDLLVSSRENAFDSGPQSVIVKEPAKNAGLHEGQLVFSGDAAGVWGRITSVQQKGGGELLTVQAVPITDLFWALDYSGTSTTALQLNDDNKSLGGSARSYECTPATTGVTLEPGGQTIALTVINKVHIKISEGTLRTFKVTLNVRSASSIAATAVSSTRTAEADCSIADWRFRLPRLSLLLFSIEPRLEFRSGITASLQGEGAGLTLPPSESSFSRTSGYAFEEGSGWQKVLKQSGEADSKAPPVITLPSSTKLNVASYDKLLITAGVEGASDHLFESSSSFELAAALSGTSDPQSASYHGPQWNYKWKLAPPPTSPDALRDLLLLISGKNVPASSTVKSGLSLDIQSPPRVWGYAGASEITLVDLGSNVTVPGLRFSFGSDPSITNGKVSVWLSGGVCTSPNCFDGELTMVAAAPISAAGVDWAPDKQDRGVYRVFFRYSLDPASQKKPYALSLPDSLLIVSSPDLTELPTSLDLRGPAGGEASAVISYYNRPLNGLGPEGQKVNLTSDLEVWIPDGSGIVSKPNQVRVYAGGRGYQRVSFPCPNKRAMLNRRLFVYSNDPELPKVELPVTIYCRTAAPRVSLKAENEYGANPLKVKFHFKTSQAQLSTSCSLDFGDGTQPQTWRQGCPEDAAVHHVYSRPGRFVATLVVSDKYGERHMDAVAIQVN